MTNRAVDVTRSAVVLAARNVGLAARKFSSNVINSDNLILMWQNISKKTTSDSFFKVARRWFGHYFLFSDTQKL